MRRFAMIAIAALVLAGCQTMGSQPDFVLIVLASEVEERPYPPELLEMPAVRSSIEQCERLRLDTCRTKTVPKDNRSEFWIGEHSSVYTLVKMGGLAPQSTYKVEWRVYDPDDGMLIKYAMTQKTISPWPSDYTMDFMFRWSPNSRVNWYPGRWRVEIFVNDVFSGQRYFRVIDDVA